MSYQVLARKYRPSQLSEVVGQEQTVQALRNALDSDRLHHAYLFAGTRGVGKTTLARILAKCMNCRKGVSSTPCGECENCIGIDSGRFVDFLEVDAASRTKVEETRELIENVRYSPTQGRHKVCLIDEVHMLTTQSFNALLKTLEEPPDHVKFIFATTEPKKIPLTVLSRCLQFYLKNISPEAIQQQLHEVLESETVPAEEEALKLISRVSEGSMRDALSITDQAIAHGDNKIAYESVVAMLGSARQDEVLLILQKIVRGDRDAFFDCITDLSARSVNFGDLLGGLARAVHELAICGATGTRPTESLLDVYAKFPNDWLQVAYQILIMGQRDLKYAPEDRIGFEMTMIRLLDFEPLTDYQPPLNAKVAHTKSSDDEDSQNLSEQPLSNAGDSAPTKPSMAEQMAHGDSGEAHTEPARSSKSPMENSKTDSNRELQPERPKTEREIMADFEANPFVKEIKDTFGGSIVSVKRVD